MAYRLYDKNSREFNVSRDVYFVKIYVQKADINLDVVVNSDHNNDVLKDDPEINPKNKLA